MSAFKKLKTGFIGCGDMAHTHVKEMLSAGFLDDKFEIVALADPSLERRESLEAAGRFSAIHFDEAADMLQEDCFDAVFICSPNNLHESHAVLAFECGSNVFLEKPMALDLDECDRILDAREKSGKLLQIGLVYRYSSLFRYMVKVVEDGVVGAPVMAWCHEFRVPFPVGRDREWRYDQAVSGGTLVEKTCHFFDLLEWLVGSHPKRVHAFGGQAAVAFGKDVEPGVPGEPYHMSRDARNTILDHAWVNIEFENSAKGNLGLSLFSANRHLPVGVLGTKGWVEACVQEKKLRIFKGETGHVEEVAPNSKSHELADVGHSGGVRQLLEFYDCVVNNVNPFCDGAIGRQSLVIALAAERSIKSGEVEFLSC